MDRDARTALTAFTVPPSDPFKMTSLSSTSPKMLARASAADPVGVLSVGVPVLVKFGRRHLQKDC